MTPEWNGIERRLERLKGCLLKLEPLKTKTSDEFASDPYLKDIVERNLEVAAQACIDLPIGSSLWNRWRSHATPTER